MLPEGYSPFSRPAGHYRKHGPFGYENYGSYRDWLRDEYLFRCCYCLVREQWYGGSAVFHIDHVQSQRAEPSLTTTYDNLTYSCIQCNLAKRDKRIPDPACLTSETVRLNEDGSFSGQTADATFLIDALVLNRASAKAYRLRIVALSDRARRQPDRHSLEFFEFPAELPDLSTMRPKGNHRPEGITMSWFELRSQGQLPAFY